MTKYAESIQSECPGHACRWRYEPVGSIEEVKSCKPKATTTASKPCWQATILMADLFRNSTFLTTYLSPRDYHRVHMPCNGVVVDDAPSGQCLLR
ncbi:phosphatidylserine decarboxylase [Shigella flexneri]